MATKSTTIVVNITEKKDINDAWNQAYRRAEVCCSGNIGDIFRQIGKEVLEAGENYIITKKDGKIVVLFYHDGECTEDIAEKITLTALNPMTEFSLELYRSEEKEVLGKRVANSAGILETMFYVPSHSIVLLQQR